MSTNVYFGGLWPKFFLSCSILNIEKTRKTMILYYIRPLYFFNIMQEILISADINFGGAAKRP